MIIISKYKLVLIDENDSSTFRVVSEENSICPVCLSEKLKSISSRKRNAINSRGDKLIIVIRKLKCTNCKKIHHELPDIVVPYKRYLSEHIESIIEGEVDIVPCESSTIYRIRQWFKRIGIHIKGSLESTAAKMKLKIEASNKTILQAIKAYVGEGPGWLSRAVRIVVNTNNWVHTHFAFMT